MKYANFYQKQFKTDSQWVNQVGTPVQKNSLFKEKLLQDFVLNLDVDSLIDSNEINQIDVQKYKYDAYIANTQFKEDENRFYDQVIRSRKATSNSPLSKPKQTVNFVQDSSPRLTRTEQQGEKRQTIFRGSPYRRPTYKRKNMAALDNLIEIHFLIKMYQDSLKFKENFSMHNKLIILNSIWGKLIQDEGRLQSYIKFLYKEIMELIIVKDDRILRSIQKANEVNGKNFGQQYISYCDAIEIFVSQTEELLKINETEREKYGKEISGLLCTIEKQQIEINVLKEIEKETIMKYEGQIKKQKTEFSGQTFFQINGREIALQRTRHQRPNLPASRDERRQLQDKKQKRY